MFFGKKKEKTSAKKKGALDKVLMGAVIGGAIGSVVGATIAPKKGSETRREVSNAVKKATQSSQGFFTKIKAIFSKAEKREAEEDPLKKIPTEDK